MSEEILATEVMLARDEFITQTQLEELVVRGPKRRLKKLPEVVITTTGEAPAQSAPQAPVMPEPEVPRDPWELFSPQNRRLIEHFEGLSEKHVLDSSVRSLISMTSDAQRVEDFATFSDSQLTGFIDTLRNRLPQINREMSDFMSRINTARVMAVEVEFI